MKYPSLSTPSQKEPLDDTQVRNRAGGYVYQIDQFTQFVRFLVLGSDQPTYYASARETTLENARVARGCWKADPERTGDLLVDYRNRVAKLDPTIFALALGFASEEPKARKKAAAVFPEIITNASQLFSFTKAVLSLRGMGRGLKSAIANWYESRSADALAYQMIKYRERQGYDHRKLLEMTHPRVTTKVDGEQVTDETKGILFRTVRARDSGKDLPRLPGRHKGDLPLQYVAYVAAQSATTKELVDLIREHRLPWEAIPTDKVRKKEVQEALLPDMPVNALVRQLGLLSGSEVLERRHLRKLKDQEQVRRSKLHPFSVLNALATYQRGMGVRSRWPVHNWVLEALNDLFYACFQNVEPTGKRLCLAVDVSGSMDWAHIQGSNITARQAAAAMALVTVATEGHCDVVAFSDRMVPVKLHRRMSLEETISHLAGIPMGGTDCALPMIDAHRKKADYDGFVIYTDSETWHGGTHPAAALSHYRQKRVGDAKLVVVGMTSTGYSIADPADPGMLDVVGFDSAAPRLISDFIRG